MADRNTKCRLAESTCRPAPEELLIRQHATEYPAKYLLPWLRFYLKGDMMQAYS